MPIFIPNTYPPVFTYPTRCRKNTTATITLVKLFICLPFLHFYLLFLSHRTITPYGPDAIKSLSFLPYTRVITFQILPVYGLCKLLPLQGFKQICITRDCLYYFHRSFPAGRPLPESLILCPEWLNRFPN
jgi:hypothetical protein